MEVPSTVGLSLAQAALEYARVGFKVLPLQPHSKIPYAGTRGVLDATDNLQIVAGYWTAYPDANIGIATGEPSGFFVVDVDPRNGGDETFASLPEGLTPTVTTGGGGLHYYLAADEMPKSTKLGPGIDVQSTGKYVVAPPSVTDGDYAFTEACSIGVAPEWLVSALERLSRPRSVVRGATLSDENDYRPGALFNEAASWDEILVPHGWTRVGENGECTYWCRPGKTRGISASTNYENSDLLWVFTSSTEFEANVSYSKFAAYAVLNYNGDFSEAAKSLVDSPALILQTSHTAAPAPTPQAYEFVRAFAPDHFVSRYIAYASKQTDAALEYHEASALSLLAACTSLVTAKLAPYPGGLHTNLYLGLVGSSTRSRKSTAQRIAIDLLDQILPSSNLPSRMTTEGLIYDLAMKAGQPTVWTPDEFGSMLAQVYRRDYLRGLEELLLTLYSCDDYDYLKADRDESTKVVHIRRPHLSVLAASTPESLALSGPGAMLSGLLPRFGIVYPSVSPPPRPAGNAPDLSTERMELLTLLRRVLQQSNERTSMDFTNEALQTLNAAESKIVSGGTHVARLPAMLYKVAVLSACARFASKVEQEDSEAAVITVMRWYEGANRLRARLRKTSEDLQFEQLTNDVMEVLQSQGGSTPRTTIAYTLRTKKAALDQVESALIDWGLIRVDRATGIWYSVS